MTVEHSALTGSDLHEPKAIASANSGELYVADGAGSGAFTAGLNKAYLNVQVTDISTAASFWVVSPVAGTITKIYSVINGAIITADAVLTAEIGGTLVTDSTVTIDQGTSAAGIVDSATPSAANTVTAGQAIEIITNGGSANTITADVTLEITKS